MTGVFSAVSGVPCRACGAVLAPSSQNAFLLCQNCWKAARNFCSGALDISRLGDGSGITEKAINGWLVHKLTNDLLRLKKTGMVGRCEAISSWAYGSAGTQCANRATTRSNGHAVCQRHAIATDPKYVDEPTDPYMMISGLMSELCSIDSRFADVLRAVTLPPQ